MEPLLLVVTVVSLVLGTAMSLTAWKLLRHQRARSAARIEALQAMSAEPDPADALRPQPVAPATRFATIDDDPVNAPIARTTVDAVRTPARDTPRAPETPASDAAIAPSLASSPVDAAPWDAMRDRAHAAAAGVTTPARQRSPRPSSEIPVHFGSTIEHAPSGRRWAALAAVATVMTAGFLSVYALYSTDVAGLINRAFTASASPATAEPLQLLSLKHTTEESGTFVLTGLVQNPPSGRPLRGVVAVVYLFDQDGRYFAGGRTPLELTSFHPGEESPFVVKVPGAAGVARYRIGFRFEGGGVVAHVDRRGQLPGGTVEDAMDDRSRVVVPPLPGRSEG